MTDETSKNIVADDMGLEIFGADGRRGRRAIFGGASGERRPRPAKTIREAARDTPVFAETDVLVVGGGPAGPPAAAAAGRVRARATPGARARPPRRPSGR